MSALRSFTPRLDFTPLKPAAAENPSEAADAGLSEEKVEQLINAAVEEARAKAYAEGEAAGRTAAEESISAASAETLDLLNSQLTSLIEKQDDLFAKIETRAVRLLLSITQKMVVRLSETESEQFAVEIARRALDAARGASRIVFRVNESMKAPMLNALSQEQRSMIETGRLIVEGDDKLSAKSVHVDWDNGSVMFDPDHLEKSVSQILSRSFEKLSQCADATDVCKEVDDG